MKEKLWCEEIMKIVVFGTGNYYQRYKDIMMQDNDIVAFLDNNATNGDIIDNVEVLKPYEVVHLVYDKIILCSIHCMEMKEQLIGYGVDEGKILFIEEFRKRLTGKKVYDSPLKKDTENKGRNEKIMVISHHFDYSGGALAALYAVKNLLDLGYQVELAIPSGEEALINEVVEAGGDVSVRPYLPFVHEGMIAEIENIDLAIVNVFPMMQTAVEISKIKPVLWWLHESGPKFCPTYPDTIKKYNQYTGDDMKYINVVGVSDRANKVFNSYFAGIAKRVMPFSIDDLKGIACCKDAMHEKIHFAVIGGISPVKAQKDFVEAVKLLDEDDGKKAEFSIIGVKDFKFYAEEIEEINPHQKYVKLTNGLSHNEMMDYYSKIDVVVCCSMEETMCMTVIEGMMFGKATIMTSTTGIAEYVEDGKNGVVIEPHNPSMLAEKMHEMIDNADFREKIAMGGRDLFEKYFTHESFRNRLSEEIKYTMNSYEDRLCKM